MTNKQQLLVKRPVGLPDADTWNLVERPVPELRAGEVLIQHHYVSLDPAMRGWMNDRKSYLPPVAIGEVMRAGTVGRVVASQDHPTLKVGDTVSGWGGVQQYSVTNGEGFYPVDTRLAPMPAYIGTLGMPGMTAYFGILREAAIKEGETVLVSAAAGAVGSVVGQIAKIKGCRVIGIAGGPEKCSYLVDTLGFDGAIDYKSDHIYAAIKQHCPKGIDVYFDNVGGEILNAALAFLRMRGRIIICGAISQYNATAPVPGPSNYLNLLIQRGTMQGMIVLDYAKDYQRAARELGQWLAEGKLHSREAIYEGIENFHPTFLRLFSGEKMGKLVLKVLEE